MKNKEEFLYFFKKILGFFEKVYMNRRTHITSFIYIYIYIYVVFVGDYTFYISQMIYFLKHNFKQFKQ
jgi:hypothetical protein